MRAFLSKLDDLQNKVLEMGGLVEGRTLHLEGFRDAERRINRLDTEIDQVATRLLALHQPVARAPSHARHNSVTKTLYPVLTRQWDTVTS